MWVRLCLNLTPNAVRLALVFSVVQIHLDSAQEVTWREWLVLGTMFPVERTAGTLALS